MGVGLYEVGLKKTNLQESNLGIGILNKNLINLIGFQTGSFDAPPYYNFVT